MVTKKRSATVTIAGGRAAVAVADESEGATVATRPTLRAATGALQSEAARRAIRELLSPVARTSVSRAAGA